VKGLLKLSGDLECQPWVRNVKTHLEVLVVQRCKDYPRGDNVYIEVWGMRRQSHKDGIRRRA
jgi:hypothetical protein